jgi:hypothetical protein
MDDIYSMFLIMLICVVAINIWSVSNRNMPHWRKVAGFVIILPNKRHRMNVEPTDFISTSQHPGQFPVWVMNVEPLGSFLLDERLCEDERYLIPHSHQ